MTTEYFEEEIGRYTLPPITTRGLTLIQAHPDITDYSHWLNDPEVVKYSELRHSPHTWEECQKYIASFDSVNSFMWTMNMVGANMHIGNITLHLDKNNSVGQMGMLIGEKWAWGRNYGREAWRGVMQWAKTHGIRRVECGCMTPNMGMRKIVQACEMPLAATIENHFKFGDEQVAKHLYGKNL